MVIPKIALLNELDLRSLRGTFAQFNGTLAVTIDAALAKDSPYTLFRYTDWPAWVIFSCVFLGLITFDNFVLHRRARALSIIQASLYTISWICIAACFCCWIFWWKGANEVGARQAYMWMSGYMLEWLLSFDNLFVFHLIFRVYGTPDHLKHRPLFFGILGAVFFRLGFIFIGEYLMHAIAIMHFVFGAFLVYTGLKTVIADEDDEDPSQQPLVMWLQSKVPFVAAYDEQGAFFVRVPVNENGEADLPEGVFKKTLATEASPITAYEEGRYFTHYGCVDFEAARHGSEQKSEIRATMLFLVVCCLEFSDLLFAVDSVSAVVAQVPDLFLAYTSAVFAMLGLRATFFIVDVLATLFSLLKYGIGVVLVFVGVKLIVGRIWHIPASLVCVVLVSAIGGSMLASLVQDKLREKYEVIPPPATVSGTYERVAKPKPRHQASSSSQEPVACV